MKSVIKSAKPYWIYLMLIGKKKEEVCKEFPKSSDWDRTVEMYCSKDKKSFNHIPAKDQEWMRKYLGKIACRFVCDSMRTGRADTLTQAHAHNNPGETCLNDYELVFYVTYGKPLYFWHISDLEIYDKPKALNEFYKVGKHDACIYGQKTCLYAHTTDYCRVCEFELKYPPQSYCYAERPQS